MENYPHIEWHWGKYGLSSNTSIGSIQQSWMAPKAVSLDFVEKYDYKPWTWGKGGLSRNPVITPEFIREYKWKDWVWGLRGISSNTFDKNLKPVIW
jgi:hypothetical protein